MSNNSFISRRHLLQADGSTAASAPFMTGIATAQHLPEGAQENPAIKDRDSRMKWWHEARFGMFIHFGLYSVLGRHEWAMELEGIPVTEYQLLAKRFNPKPHAARAWAKLAKTAGMKYMVMTTKHHEGFCLFDTKTTNYSAPQQAAGRDLVAEFVEAARAEGLGVGFYYSLMDWHHPDGVLCKTNAAARRRFVDYVHEHVGELCTNYGKVDILWYDVNWPLTTEEWEAQKLNNIVRGLQPDILINNRSGIPEDFQTPEQHVQASDSPWEACMTMNDSWGYQRSDDDWKSAKSLIRNLLNCARDQGNYLLNIGPKPDGSIPEQSIRILTAVGKWMDKHGDLIHRAELCKVKQSAFAQFTRQGNTLYIHAYFWPGEMLSIGGLQQKVLSAKFYPGGQAVKFEQQDYRVRFIGLPASAPDPIATVLAVECDGEPTQEQNAIRTGRKREGVGV
jgi:alpha-L-fucosidase